MLNCPNISANCSVNPTALRKAKIKCNFGLSGCNRVKIIGILSLESTQSPSFHLIS